MNQKTVFALWGGLFILCAGLGFIPEPGGAAQYALTALAFAFFLPPAWLLKNGDRDTVRLVRNLAGLSLILTVLALIMNFVMAAGSGFLGNVLHFILVVVSAPMIACGNWALSLFMWACVLMGSFKKLR